MRWRWMSLVFLASITVRAAGDDHAEQDAADVAKKVAAVIEPYASSNRFSGVVLAVRGENTLYEGRFGVAQVPFQVAHGESTRYKLHSLSKPITAVLAMKAAAAGKLSLDDPVSEHVSGWPPAWGTVTVRHLLSHTSGVPDLVNPWLNEWAGSVEKTWKATAAGFARHRLAFAPGEKWQYCNMGYVIVSMILEKVYETSFEQALQARVFKPLAMKNAGLEKAPPTDGRYSGALAVPRLASGYNGKPEALQGAKSRMYAIPGAGGVYATARDVAAFARGVFQGGFLSPESIAEMTRVPEGVKTSYALGWAVSKRLEKTVYRHDGGDNGFVTSLEYFPELDLSIVVLSNYGFAPMGEIRAKAAEAILAAL